MLRYLHELRERLFLFKGFLLKRLLLNNNVLIGKSLEVAAFPKLTLHDNHHLYIGDNVKIGRQVDLRIYENASLVIEDNCKLDDGVRIVAANGNKVHLKKNTKIGFYSVVNGGGSVVIGPDTSTYGFVYIQSSSHVYKRESGFNKSDYTHKGILIGKSVLLGPHTVVMPGVVIEDNTIVEAHTILRERSLESL